MAAADDVKRPLALAWLLVLPSALLLLWAWPRAAVPIELPSLALPRGEVSAALAAEDALAAEAPTSVTEEGRRAAYLEQGRAELRGPETPMQARGRLDRLRALMHDLEVADPDALAAARAADVRRMERALRGEGTDEERAGELGVFPTTLARWHAIEGDVRVAPPIVVRALAAARWNALFDRPLTDGMSPLHLRAYHGWLALHGAIGWSELRERALVAYAGAGGTGVHEARGVLLYFEGERELAAIELAEAYEATGNLRLRNHWIAALPE